MINKKIKIAGIDPSLTNTGICIGEYDLDTNTYTLQDIFLIETAPTKNKQIRKNSDDLERCGAIANAIYKHCSDCSFVFAEIPVGSQNFRAAFAFGMVIGILAGISKSPNTKWRLHQVSPSEAKAAIPNGTKNTSKPEIMDWAWETFPDLQWQVRKDKLVNKMEHPADAIAILNAGVKSEYFLDTIQILKCTR